MRALRHFWKSRQTKKRVFLTLFLIVLYRALLHFPLPGITTTPDQIQQNITPGSGLYTFLDFLGMLSGSSLLRLSLLSLGLLPYNLTSVLIYVLVPLIPGMEQRLKFDPRQGRALLEKWNTYLAVPVAGIISFSFIFFISPNCEGRFFLLERQGGSLDPLFTVTTVTMLTAGSFFAVWLSSLISEFGIRGKGNAILIASGIIGQLPQEIARLLTAASLIKTLVAYAALFVGCILIVVFLLDAKRNVSVAYPGRRVGGRLSGPALSTLPLSLSMGSDGLIGSQLVVALATFYAPLATCSGSAWINTGAFWIIAVFGEDSPWFGPVAFFSVMLFSFFYADGTFQEQNLAENLRRAGALIPGVPPGRRTQAYLLKIVRRISLPGAILLGILAIAPWVFNLGLGVSLSLLDGEKLLILVATIRDSLYIVDADLILEGYDQRAFIR